MQLSSDARDAIRSELSSFSKDLNLSDDQKDRLHTALEGAREKFEEYRSSHPGLTREDVVSKLKESRGPLRARLEGFLTSDQLSKWDAEVAKAKTFLGVSSS
jgi:hypothetical protein